MIPDTLTNYFIASTGAGAALVGLVFVGISLSPREAMEDENAPQWRAVTGQAFIALVNAFIISLAALNTTLNMGWFVVIMSVIGLSNSVWLGIPLLKRARNRKRELVRIVANRIMILLGLILYGIEGYFGIRFLLAPDDTAVAQGISIVLMLVYSLGLTRAWELIGLEQVGIRRWLNPLHKLKSTEDDTDNEQALVEEEV